MTPLSANDYRNVILEGDVLDRLRELPDESVHMCVTSPPYWGLRSYGTETWEGGDEECDHSRPRSSVDKSRASSTIAFAANTGHDQEPTYRDACGKCGAVRIDRQIGLEATPEAYVSRMVEVFREVRRVLRNDGTLWLNLGSSYVSEGGQRSYGSYDDATGRGPQPRRVGVRRGGRSDMASDSVPYLDFTRLSHHLKPKDLAMIPSLVALALQADGWWLRSEITWCKGAPMPESVRDRPTSATEKIFLLSKSERYYYDGDAERDRASNAGMVAGVTMGTGRAAAMGREPSGNEAPGAYYVNGPTRNLWNYWVINPEPYAEAHFATFPTEIPRRCIRLGSPEGGLVLDPFMGAGTTALVALLAGRDFVGVELNPEYIAMAEKRIAPYRHRLL